MMKSDEITYEKVYASPRLPPKISFKDNWMKELGSEVAGGSEDSQQTPPKTKNPIVRTGRLVKSEQPSGSLTQDIDKGVLFGCESTNVSTGRPVNSCVPVSFESLDKDKDADENVDADQIRMERQVKSGQSIETIPKVHCTECLLYWNQGVIYCICGHLLVESESSHIFHHWRLDALSIPHYVIRKGRPRGARHGKTESQKEHFVAHNACKRCIKKNFDGIHDRFQRDPVYRDSQLKIGWTEEKCIAMVQLAQEDHSHCPSSEEYERFQKKLLYLTEHMRQKCTDETLIRLPNSSHINEPSPPRIWRRST